MSISKNDYTTLDEMVNCNSYSSLLDQFKLYNSFFEIFPKDEIKKVVTEVIDESDCVSFPSKRHRRTSAKFKPSFTLKLLREHVKDERIVKRLNACNTDNDVITVYNDLIRDEMVGPIADKLFERINSNPKAKRLLEELHINKETKTMRACISSLFIIDIEAINDSENFADYKNRDLLFKFVIFM